MSRVFAVYVAASNEAQANLTAGLGDLVWGWQDPVLDQADHRAVAERARPGDLLVMGSLGPSPRVIAGGWDEAVLRRVLLLRLTSALFVSERPVWPDDPIGLLYRNRVGFEVLYDFQAPEAARLDPFVLEALRWSANTRGSLVEVAGDQGSTVVFGVDDPEDAGTLDHVGDFEYLAERLVRREQRKLRKRKFGDARQVVCDLCGRAFPARLVRAAHIKPRSKCTPDQLRNLNNVMAACALGCDELFEHGYVAVDARGVVRAGRAADGDLANAVGVLEGKHCRAHTTRSEDFFAWHLDALA